jgi:hypothetical protein
MFGTVVPILVCSFAPTEPSTGRAESYGVRLLVGPRNIIAEATRADNLASELLANDELNANGPLP